MGHKRLTEGVNKLPAERDAVHELVSSGEQNDRGTKGHPAASLPAKHKTRSKIAPTVSGEIHPGYGAYYRRRDGNSRAIIFGRQRADHALDAWRLLRQGFDKGCIPAKSIQVDNAVQGLDVDLIGKVHSGMVFQLRV